MENTTNEEIDKTLYNEKALSILNVGELRDIGRKFCVPAPTTLKKKDLIDYILKIVYGEIQAPARNNFGRPSKAQFDMPKYLEKIKNNKDMSSELIKIKLDMDYGSLMVSDKTQKYKDYSGIESRILCEKNGKFYLKKHQFVDSEKDIEISNELVHKFNLEELDVVEIIVIENEFKIVTINGIRVKSGFRDLILDKKPIQSGNKQDFYYSTKEEINDWIDKLITMSNSLNIRTIIYSSQRFEDATSCFVYEANGENSQNYKKFMGMLSMCEKYMRESEDVILVIDNMADVEKMIGSFESSVTERIKSNIEKVTSKFLGFENSIVAFRVLEKTTY